MNEHAVPLYANDIRNNITRPVWDTGSGKGTPVPAYLAYGPTAESYVGSCKLYFCYLFRLREREMF